MHHFDQLIKSHVKYPRKRYPGINSEVSKTVALQFYILENVDGRLAATQDSFLHSSVSSSSPSTGICFASRLLKSLRI